MNYIFTVTEINKYISAVISRDMILSNLWVKGEISNLKCHYTGHIYFTLKDSNCLIKCVMFKNNAMYMKFKPENGMNVIVKGYVSVFERDGQYQLYAEEMQPDGIGSLHIAFEQLKKKLEGEGLFDPSKKKKLPYLPQRIGVVTSLTGAVIRDIINVLNRRFYNACLKIYPVAVQGDTAPPQIAHAIRRLNELDCVDVIIIARGGGSLEELWAFNDEMVARAVYESHIPIISAIGHETDYTICDFVADVRAPTPSAAAEIVMPEKNAEKNRLGSLEVRLKNALNRNLSKHRIQYEKLKSSMVFKHPYNRIYQERLKLESLNKDLQRVMENKKNALRSKLNNTIAKLDALSPLRVLVRGYSVFMTDNNDVIRSVYSVKKGDKVKAILKDGTISCTVDDTKGGNIIGEKIWT